MWFFYALIAGCFFTGSRLIERHLLKGKKDSWAYSFWFSFIGALVGAPFMAMDFQVSGKITIWAIVFSVAVLYVVHNLMSFKATNHLSPSIKGAITKFRLIWIFIFGIIFLSEAFTGLKFLGMLSTVAAGILVLGKLNSKSSQKGITILFFSTFIYALNLTLFSWLLNDFSAPTLNFFLLFLPAMINLIVMPNALSRVTQFLKTNPVLILTANISAGFGLVAFGYALADGEQSRVTIIMEVFLIAILGMEYFVLKEKERPSIKLLAVILAILGAIAVRFG